MLLKVTALNVEEVAVAIDSKAGGIAGVTELLALLAVEVPLALVAVTVNV